MDPHPEENRKLPAAAMPNSAPPKRRKDNEGNAVVASDEVTDVAKSLGFQLGDRVEGESPLQNFMYAVPNWRIPYTPPLVLLT